MGDKNCGNRLRRGRQKFANVRNGGIGTGDAESRIVIIFSDINKNTAGSDSGRRTGAIDISVTMAAYLVNIIAAERLPIQAYIFTPVHNPCFLLILFVLAVFFQLCFAPGLGICNQTGLTFGICRNRTKSGRAFANNLFQLFAVWFGH